MVGAQFVMDSRGRSSTKTARCKPIIALFSSCYIWFLITVIASAQEGEEASIGNQAITNSSEPSTAEPQEQIETEAKRLFEQGLEMMGQQRWNEAEQAFRFSNDAIKRPSSSFNLAICLLEQNKYAESIEVISRFAKDGDFVEDVSIHSRADELLKHLQTLVGTLEIEVNPHSALIELDQKSTWQKGPIRSYTLNPGKHLVTVSQKGFTNIRLEIDIESGVHKKTSVQLSPLPTSIKPEDLSESNASPRLPLEPFKMKRDDSYGAGLWPWILSGIGGAMLLSSGITAILATDLDSKMEETCPELTNCKESDRKKLTGLMERRDNLYLATDIALLGGAITIGTGIALWLLIEDDEPNPEVVIAIDRRNLITGLTGRF
ncbi:MAG: PEGA domain-containing protein [Deltaproteobacteria bacterium]|nr:PEGA domain-containing protein [Deltaproteobacteria bacterium]